MDAIKFLNQELSWDSLDKKLKDPVWELTSMRMNKYSPFLNTDVFRYKKIMKDVILGEK